MRFLHNIPTLIARQRRLYKAWAQSVSIDFIDCPHERVDNKDSLREFVLKITKLIHQRSQGPIYIDRFEDEKLHLAGYTAMALHDTFSITVHLDEIDNRAFVDIFSCEEFDLSKVIEFSKEYFAATKVKFTELER